MKELPLPKFINLKQLFQRWEQNSLDDFSDRIQSYILEGILSVYSGSVFYIPRENLTALEQESGNFPVHSGISLHKPMMLTSVMAIVENKGIDIFACNLGMDKEGFYALPVETQEGAKLSATPSLPWEQVVVNRMDLKKFEQKHLGIDHGLDLSEKDEVQPESTPEPANYLDKSIPNYLDESNPNYAPDLALAIEAWQAVNEGYGRKGDTFKNRAIYWLEESHNIGRKDRNKGFEKNNLEATAERIATIANPNRRK